MSEERRDPYQVLGVPRDASPRVVKSAYFALVREHPPETHPAEFQELRDAYELLSDPDRRAALDASQAALADLGAEQAALLRAAQQALAQGDLQGGEQLLRRLVADHPDLLVAREQLGFALLRREAWKEAEAVWAALVERAPKDPRHHLHLGYARHRDGRPAEAIPCHARALQLGGGEEARLAVVHALEDHGDWKQALAVLEEGIAEAGAIPPPRLVRRKVALLLLHGSARRAWKAFDALAASLAGREAERAAQAEELASLAAWLFARNRQRLANQLLRRLAAIDPGRRPDRLFPEKTTIPVRDLPPESVEWLEGKRQPPERIVEAEHGRARSLLALVPGALLVWTLAAGARGADAWDDARVVWTGVGCCAAALALGFGGLRFHLALTARLPRLRLVHPLYYLEVDYDRVHAFPVVNLHDVKVVQHSTNGAYTHTVLHLPFGGRTRRLRFRHPPHASRLAERLLQRRRRALELLANGLLETEAGIDLIPAAALAGGALRSHQRTALVAAAALLVGLVGFGGILELHAHRREASAWSDLVGGSGVPGQRTYLAAHPDAAPVRAALDAWARDLEADPFALPDGPGRPVAVALGRAAVVSPGAALALSVSWSPGPAPTGGLAACKPPLPAAAASLAAALQAALDQTFPPGLLKVSPADESGPLRLSLEVGARPAGAYSAGEPGLPNLPAVTLDWVATLELPGAPPARLEGSAPPPSGIGLGATWRGRPATEGPCADLAAAQLAAVVRGVARAMGLRSAGAAVEVAP
jgi:tetratricopeptide (TPR) repeat protein